MYNVPQDLKFELTQNEYLCETDNGNTFSNTQSNDAVNIALFMVKGSSSHKMYNIAVDQKDHVECLGGKNKSNLCISITMD